MKELCHMKELCFIHIPTRPKQMCDMKELCDVNEGAVSYEWDVKWVTSLPANMKRVMSLTESRPSHSLMSLIWRTYEMSHACHIICCDVTGVTHFRAAVVSLFVGENVPKRHHDVASFAAWNESRLSHYFLQPVLQRLCPCSYAKTSQNVIMTTIIGPLHSMCPRHLWISHLKFAPEGDYFSHPEPTNQPTNWFPTTRRGGHLQPIPDHLHVCQTHARS